MRCHHGETRETAGWKCNLGPHQNCERMWSGQKPIEEEPVHCASVCMAEDLRMWADRIDAGQVNAVALAVVSDGPSSFYVGTERMELCEVGDDLQLLAAVRLLYTNLAEHVRGTKD